MGSCRPTRDTYPSKYSLQKTDFNFHYDLLLMCIICLGVGTMWKWAMLQMLRINFCLVGSSLCLRACCTMFQHLKTGCALVQMFGYTGCTRTNLPYFGRPFRRLNYVDITKCTHIQCWNNDELSFTFTFIDYNQCNLTCMCYLTICMLTYIYYQLIVCKVEVIHLYHSTVHCPK